MDAAQLPLMTATATTSLGPIALLVDRAPATSSRPVVLMIHGAMRQSEGLLPWYPILTPVYDVVFADLPGHARSPGVGPPDLAALVQRFREVIDKHFKRRDLVIVGESVGGLVALSLADGTTPEVKGVVAADPPLSTAKQWVVHGNVLGRLRDGSLDEYGATFMAEVFGFTADGPVAERAYYDLVRDVQIPALILTGDTPLWPVAKREGNVPCLIDLVDRYVIGMLGNACVSIAQLSNIGHLCLDRPGEECRNCVLRFCSERLLETRTQMESTTV